MGYVLNLVAIVNGWDQASEIALDLCLREPFLRFLKLVVKGATLTKVHNEVNFLATWIIYDFFECDYVLMLELE